eukprot:420521_1
MADDNDGDLVDSQDSDLPKQLEAGIRALDIRCRESGGWFAIHHGIYYLSANFHDVLNQCQAFLSSHPTEFILMRVMQESAELKIAPGDVVIYHANPDDKVSDQEFNNVFAKYFDDTRYNGLFYKPPAGKGYDNYMPTVGEVKGKIVILQDFGPEDSTRYGIKYGFGDGSKYIQDKFGLDDNWSLYYKWIAVQNHLAKANNAYNSNKMNGDMGFYVNFLSAAMGGSVLVFPYFVASGHSDPRSNAPRLSTGMTKCVYGDKYPDFPKVNCAFNPFCWDTDCTIAFEGTNILTYDYIHNHHVKYTGIVYIDFPGQGLIDRIIALNVVVNNQLTGWSGAQNFGFAGDGFNHLRACEGRTITLSCASGHTLSLGGCWYGSPVNDGGYNMCPHSAKGHCNPQGMNCGGYIGGHCNGRQSCSIVFNNGNMGGDPCPNIYKFGAIAIRCNYVYSAQSDQPNLIQLDDWEVSDFNDRNDGTYFKPFLMVIFGLIFINIVCCVIYCCKQRRRKHGKYEYKPVSQESSETEREIESDIGNK